MKRSFLLFYCLLVACFNSYCQSVQMANLDIQNNNIEPEGVWLRSATSNINHQTFAYLGLQRKSYRTFATGSGNDRNDKVGVWIKGFYQNVGDALPIYLGGNGYQNEDFKMVIESNGNVGIGSNSPIAKLDIVNGSSRLVMLNNNTGLGDQFAMVGLNGYNLTFNSFTPALGNFITRLGINYSVNGGDGSSQYSRIGSKYSPLIELNADDGSVSIFGENGSGSNFRTPSLHLGLKISNEGKVGIGTTSLAEPGYKLFVETGIRTRKVKVDQASWADYVFYKDYKLLPLNELEKFVLKNKHLPEIPSAKEVAANGVDLGENQAQLLKKIEELTLYVIKLNKKIEAMESIINLKN